MYKHVLADNQYVFILVLVNIAFVKQSTNIDHPYYRHSINNNKCASQFMKGCVFY